MVFLVNVTELRKQGRFLKTIASETEVFREVNIWQKFTFILDLDLLYRVWVTSVGSKS